MENLDLKSFPQTNKDSWYSLAEKQLKGADPKETLVWQNDANIDIEPYYDSSDLFGLAYLQEFFSKIKSHRWKLYEHIKIHNEKDANKMALEALRGGCNGIIFMNENSFENHTLLKNIDPEICDLGIISNVNISADSAVFKFNESPEGNVLKTKESENPIKQLVEIKDGLDAHKIIHRIAHSDFFLEIASVRALKYILRERTIHIHSEVPLHDSAEHQWFLNTTAGLASILGGSHSIAFTTAIGNSRISRNIGNLIREESGIDYYSDQCGGSYYVELLTHNIIQEVINS